MRTSGPSTTPSRTTTRSSTPRRTSASSPTTPRSSPSGSTGTTYGGRDIVAPAGDQGRDRLGHPRPARRPLQRDAARARVAGGRDVPADAQLLRRQLRQGHERGQGGRRSSSTTPSCGSSASTTPTATSTRSPPGNRLWRKNLADNDNDDVIDQSTTASTRTGTSRRTGAATTTAARPTRRRRPTAARRPASEPETQAMEALFAEINPVFQKNDHTAASLLLYPQGFQQDTPSADHEIFTALAGDPFKPAIPGFIPELSAALYITNGDFTDWAYNTQDTLSFTPEGTPAEDPSVTGFEYPDSPLQIQQEFERHLPFALDLAHSADDPAEPALAPRQHGRGLHRRQVHGVLRQPAAGGRRRQARARHGEDALHASTAKKAKKVATDDYEGGERYYKERRRLLPPRPGRREGHGPGRRGQGVVHRGRREVQVLHLRGRGRDRQPRADPRPTRTTRACSRTPRPMPGPKYLDYYTDALDAAGRRLRRLRRRRARPPAARSARDPRPLLARRLVHGRRLRAARARRAGRLRHHQGARSTRRTPCATS